MVPLLRPRQIANSDTTIKPWPGNRVRGWLGSHSIGSRWFCFRAKWIGGVERIHSGAGLTGSVPGAARNWRGWFGFNKWSFHGDLVCSSIGFSSLLFPYYFTLESPRLL